MAYVVYGQLVVANHARHGFLATPMCFGDFPAVVGSPYFLGVVPAAQEAPAKEMKPTPAGGNKPHYEGQVFSCSVRSERRTLLPQGMLAPDSRVA
ncbi:hypothetical protein Taro_022820 [Colocasia esculenta]|uniref:Uncharacterized protein n=1 Tax=Colocasia esculenta TaxID=4460 RepID=A0A843V6G8_COLES|nr:hypothetical protein [Colocasia esculenta]